MIHTVLGANLNSPPLKLLIYGLGFGFVIPQRIERYCASTVRVHPHSQSLSGKRGTVAMSWRQRKYQDNPPPNMCSSNYAKHSNRL